MVRAHDARKKATALNPLVLQRYAMILKAGDVRCGHAMVEITDAKGEGGATYKLTEHFKAAMSGDGQSARVDYSGELLLGADLGILSGVYKRHTEFMNDKVTQNVDSTAMVTIKDDKLTWTLEELRKGDKTPVKLDTKPMKLYGVKPAPKNALISFATLAATGTEGFKPDPKEPYCVPTLEVDAEGNTAEIEPAWITLSPRSGTQPNNTAMQMRVRYIVGEANENGLEVETPTPDIWYSAITTPLDEKFRPLQFDIPDDPRIHAEAVAYSELKTDAPLELEKIEAALKKEEVRIEKQEKGNK